MLFQQESSHNPSPDTLSTATSTISPRNSPLPLFGIFEIIGCHLLDSRKGVFAIRADWSLGFFGKYFGYKSSTWCFDGDGAAGFGGVMSPYECGAFVRHGV